MTQPNPNSLAAFLLKKKTLNQQVSVQQPAPTVLPLTVAPSAEGIAEESIVDPVVAEESKVAEEITASKTTVVDSEPESNSAHAQNQGRILSTPKPVKVANVLNREVLRKKASEMSLDDVSELTGDEVDPGVSESEFKEVLDILDKKMMQDKVVDDLNLSDFRNIIARIMIDLKANPSYAGLMVDSNVHNIMAFMWATQAKAIENNVKKETKAKTTKASVAKKSGLALAFNKVLASDLSL